MHEFRSFSLTVLWFSSVVILSHGLYDHLNLRGTKFEPEFPGEAFSDRPNGLTELASFWLQARRSASGKRAPFSRRFESTESQEILPTLVSRVEILWLEGAEAAGQRNHYQLDLCRQILLGQRKSKSKDCTRRLYKKQRPLQKLLALKSSRHCTRQTGNLLGWYVAITWCRRLQLWDGCFACDGQAVCTGWSVFEVTKMKGLNAS